MTSPTYELPASLRRGTPRAALRWPSYRTVWVGAFVSSIGTWMQNVIISEWAYSLTGSKAYVGQLTFALLGPSLVLPLIGGVLADRFDRRKLATATLIWQMVGCLLLARLAAGSSPSRAGVLACVALIGMGQALTGPAYQALLPSLVPPADLPGAISLGSLQMNLSRVLGPVVGGLIRPRVGVAGIFLANGLTFIAIIAALWRVEVPAQEPRARTRPSRELLEGIRAARKEPTVSATLSTLAIFSFCCLAFIALMPALASDNLKMPTDGFAYGALYAFFGLGAALGSLLPSTIARHVDRQALLRTSLLAFAALLAAFGALRDPAPAYPVVLGLGVAYFCFVTTLQTVLQARLESHVRGRVMSLWMMAFAGTVPLGVLVAGRVADATSVSAVVWVGAAVAVALVPRTIVRSKLPDPHSAQPAPGPAH